MERYVEPTSQLVAEIFVRDIARSRAFYEALGFTPEEDKGDFVSLSWEGHLLFLDQRTDLPPVPAQPQINIRVMVPNVEEHWARALAAGATIVAPLADRGYGLLDFTIVDPDGIGVRFGTRK
jgi:catechol 2,3-dioxygenase-like lactoylglutathione lyase family enzyme